MEKSITQDLPDCQYLHRFVDGDTGGHVIIHQKRCLKCIEWIHENNQGRFNELLKRALQSKTSEMYNIVNFAISKGYKSNELELLPPQENELQQQITRCASHFRYPQDISQLPVAPGVYIVVLNNKNSNSVVYVGSSLNVYLRLRTHGLEELQTLTKAGAELIIYCLLFPLHETEEAMRITETHLIRELRPSLNKRL